MNLIKSPESNPPHEKNLSILKLPNPINLIEMNSRPHNNCTQYYNSKNKENLAMHSLLISKDILLNSL